MVVLQPVFSVWIGKNAVDFAYFRDTVIYARADGTVIVSYREGEGWGADTLVTTHPGIRAICVNYPILYLAYFRKVLVYRADTLKDKMKFPFVVSGLACRGDTLFLHDSHHVYLKLPDTAPIILYTSDDVLKSMFFRGDTLFVLQRNYLLRLAGENDTVVVFEGLADISAVYPVGKAFAALFGSGDLVLYFPPKGKRKKPESKLLLEGIHRFRVYGDTLVSLKGDTLSAYLIKFRKRWKGRGRRWRR